MKLKTGLLVATSILSGCAAYHQPTAEERAMALQMQQAFLQRFQGGAPVTTAINEPQKTEVDLLPTRTEEELKIAFEHLESPQSSQLISRARDGIKIGHKIFLDPEGEVIDFGFNVLTGDITYVLKSPNNRKLIKFMRAGVKHDPITLGLATDSANTVSVKTASGKNITGDRLVPTSKGFVVTRESSAFEYVIGQGLTSLASPENYHVAQFQNGDISSTGYVLMEKNSQNTGNNTGSIGELISIGSSLGSTLGISEVDDYLLYNIEDGKTISFDMSIEGKDIAIGKGCRKANSFANKCASFDFKESLYEQDGSKNIGHYFWKISWFNTPEGTFAVAQEGGTRKITITELSSGNKAILFERMLGIAGWEASQDANGTISVTAQLGFSHESLKDAVAVFKKSAFAQK